MKLHCTGEVFGPFHNSEFALALENKQAMSVQHCDSKGACHVVCRWPALVIDAGQ